MTYFSIYFLSSGRKFEEENICVDICKNKIYYIFNEPVDIFGKKY